MPWLIETELPVKFDERCAVCTQESAVTTATMEHQNVVGFVGVAWVETILLTRGSAIQPLRVASRVERTENDRGGAIESPRFRGIASIQRCPLARLKPRDGPIQRRGERRRALRASCSSAPRRLERRSRG